MPSWPENITSQVMVPVLSDKTPAPVGSTQLAGGGAEGFSELVRMRLTLGIGMPDPEITLTTNAPFWTLPAEPVSVETASGEIKRTVGGVTIAVPPMFPVVIS